MNGKDNILKPPALRPGDTVGLISPSWGGAGAFPHRTAAGIKQLHTMGYTVKLGRHALNQHGEVSDTPENRAGDLHEMFADPQVRAIIAAIGGNHSVELLPLLDFDLIRSNPTVFMGYSDITVLNVAIWQQTGLVTFNGPALLTDFAEQPEMFAYTRDYLHKALCAAAPVGAIEPSPWWTEELQDWEAKADLDRPRDRFESEGWTWLKDGVTDGVLVGGCLGSLDHLRLTRYWPDWEDTIFFFETSEECSGPAEVDRRLAAYEEIGVFDKLKGMLVGRPYRFSAAEKEQLRELLLARTWPYRFPIVTDMDFGHTAPQFTLPLGVRARIDAGNQQFEILEAAVR